MKTNKLKKMNQKRNFIPEYVENYTLIPTGDANDINHYDLKIKDQQGQTFIIRKTVRGNNKVGILILLKTPENTYVNKQRVYTQINDPLNIYCIRAEKQWKFTYKGEFIETKHKQKTPINVSFEATFKSDEPIVDMFDHINYQTLKHKTILPSEEKLIKQDAFKEIVAYEQEGMINAQIKLDDQLLTLASTATRKHRFGKLDFQGLFKILKSN